MAHRYTHASAASAPAPVRGSRHHDDDRRRDAPGLGLPTGPVVAEDWVPGTTTVASSRRARGGFWRVPPAATHRRSYHPAFAV